MVPPSALDTLSPSIQAAFATRGYASLTPIQQAVLDPSLAGRDLRIFSQTGSGKTVAVGLAMAPELERAVAERASAQGAARPLALLIAPTRELATQIGGELSWLFAPLGVEVASVTGGASYARELAALRRHPLVVAGTPGRLLDHLERGRIDPSALAVVVLDEADQMLDLGFKDELDAILERTPPERRTLLLSATFPREVKRLADRCQKDPVVVAGEGAGEANVDIAHVAHLVLSHERDGALLNLLLMAPGERALVFVRTREGASELADRLTDVGLPARAIHGDLEQRDRTRTLDAFRSGKVSTLVATDVAARGIDVPDVARVIHVDLPGDSEVLTHRSGRTGRAGKKGLNVVLVPPAMQQRARAMLRSAGVEATWSAAPSAADVQRAADERLAAEITRSIAEGEAPDPGLRALAERLIGAAKPVDLVIALLARAGHAGPCAPAEVTPISPQTAAGPRAHRAANGHVTATRTRAPREAGATEPGAQQAGFVPFQINWGERHGADPRRLLAMICRRGGIRGNEVGAIRIGETHSTFDVAAPAATSFAQAAMRPDARDPKIRIEARSAPRPAPRARAR